MISLRLARNMTSFPNSDVWKDEFLARPEITQSEFSLLPDEQKLWLIENKHIFYNVNGGVILNLAHTKYNKMAKLLRTKR